MQPHNSDNILEVYYFIIYVVSRKATLNFEIALDYILTKILEMCIYARRLRDNRHYGDDVI